MYGLVNIDKPLNKGEVLKIRVGTLKIARYEYGTPVIVRSTRGEVAYGRVVGVNSHKNKKYIFIEVLNPKPTQCSSCLAHRTHPISRITKLEYNTV